MILNHLIPGVILESYNQGINQYKSSLVSIQRISVLQWNFNTFVHEIAYHSRATDVEKNKFLLLSCQI
jgi:uncharacterized protein